MAKPEVSLPNRIYAKATYEYLSTIGRKWAFVARHVVGDNPVQWYLTKTPASRIAWNWAEGDHEHGLDPRPVSFDSAFVLATRTDLLRGQQEKMGGKPAVAFRVGQAAVAGFLWPNSETGDGLIQVGLRVGTTGRDATIGLLDLSTRTFTQAEAGAHIILEHVSVDDFAERFSFPLQ